MTSLIELSAVNNSLTGVVGSSLCELPMLGSLFIQHNNFTCFDSCIDVGSSDIWVSGVDHCPSPIDEALCQFSQELSMETVMKSIDIISSVTIFESAHPLTNQGSTSISLDDGDLYKVSFDHITRNINPAVGVIFICSDEKCLNTIFRSDQTYAFDDSNTNQIILTIHSSTLFVQFHSGCLVQCSFGWGYRLIVESHSKGHGWGCISIDSSSQIKNSQGHHLVSAASSQQSGFQWYASNFCSWTGITCVNNTAIISQLSLKGLGIAGTIPGSILATFADLTLLDLSSNKFQSTIPSELSALKKLESIDLSYNQSIDRLCTS